MSTGSEKLVVNIPDVDSWNSVFEFVTQTGAETGNNELQDYIPSQLKVNGHVDLVLEKVSGNRYKSGKLKSTKAINELAPEHGALEIEFVLPENFLSDKSSPIIVPGLWPAIWLLPNSGNWPTGGEIDLMEMMQFAGQQERAAFSTLHFGPSTGVDAVYDGHWGLNIASYKWDPARPTQKIRFEWMKTEDGKWKLTQWVNDSQVWDQTTAHVGVFKDFEKGKNFQRASQSDFAPGGPGDPVPIFQRAFDDKHFGMRLIINLAFGGTPWEYDRRVNLNLQKSTMRIAKLRVWDLKRQAATATAVTPSHTATVTNTSSSLVEQVTHIATQATEAAADRSNPAFQCKMATAIRSLHDLAIDALLSAQALDELLKEPN